MMCFTYESDRLVLKALNQTSASLVLDFLSRNRSSFDSLEGEKPPDFYTIEFIQKMMHNEYNLMVRGTTVRYYVLKKGFPTLIIGTVSFTGFRFAPYQTCHIGYKFDAEYHHQGYAYEAIAELLGYVITEFHFHRIEAHILPDNLPSIRLVQKLGFVFEGIAVQYARVQGTWKDHLQYALVCNTGN